AHIDDAGQPEARPDGGHRHAVLAGTGLGNDARPTHATSELDLPQAIVDLVRAGVVQLVALEVDLGAAEMPGETLGEIERARPSAIVGKKIVELCLEGGVGLGLGISPLKIQDQRHESFSHIAAAIEPEMAALVRPSAV